MNKDPENNTCLVADIGGTNTRVALAHGSHLVPESITRFSNSDHTSLKHVLESFIGQQENVTFGSACVAVAGPVEDGVGALTNLDWSIDRETLRQVSGAKDVDIINDLQAQGHALGHLSSASEQVLLGTPSANQNATKLVIGVGTGFNVAAVFDTGSDRLVPPSECGHSGLPIRNQDDLEMRRFLSGGDFLAIEEVLSGRGLENVYRWHRHQSGDPGQKSAADIMASAENKTDDTAIQTVQTVSRTLGAVAGDMALVYLPFGGIYLVGGVARALAPHLKSQGFGTSFRKKGGFAGFMDGFSVSMINDDWAALIGCGQHMVTNFSNLELTRGT